MVFSQVKTVFVSPGVDKCGRTVVVVVGRNIPVTLIDLEKVKRTFQTFKTFFIFAISSFFTVCMNAIVASLHQKCLYLHIFEC